MGQVIQMDNRRPLPGVRVLYASGVEERRSAVCAADVPLCEFCEADWCEHECHNEEGPR